MKIRKIRLINVGSIAHEEIACGHVNEIRGPNGAGKSLREKAIRSALTVEGRTDDFSRLLDETSDTGSTTIIATDATITRTYSKAGSSLIAKHKSTKEKHGAEANRYIKETFDPEVINAEAFLDKDPKKQAQTVLAAIPFTLDRDAFQLIVPDVAIPKDQHPLEAVDGIHKIYYDKRTEVNRTAREAEANAKRLYETQPAPQDLAGIDREIAEAESYVQSVESQRSEALEHATIVMAKNIGVALSSMNFIVGEARRFKEDATTAKRADIQSQIDALNRELASFEMSALDTFHSVESAQERVFNSVKESETKTYDDLQSTLDAEREDALSITRQTLATLRASRDAEVSAKAVRDIAWESEHQGELLRQEAEKLTETLSAIADFKGNMLKNMPIPGVTMVDGEILIDGKRMDEVPESRRCILAIDLAIARGAEPIIVDGCDKLDDANFAKIIEHLRSVPRQSFLARWSNDEELKVVTYDNI